MTRVTGEGGRRGKESSVRPEAEAEGKVDSPAAASHPAVESVSHLFLHLLPLSPDSAASQIKHSLEGMSVKKKMSFF